MATVVVGVGKIIYTFKRQRERSSVVLVLCVLSLNSFLVCSALGQSGRVRVSVSHRVGEIIEPNERDYFGLFPRFASFESAEFYQIDDTSYAVEIKYRRESDIADTTVDIKRAEFQELRRFIDRFEYLYDEFAEVEWAFLLKVARPVNHINPNALGLVVTLSDGSEIKGRLVYLNNRLLVLESEPAKALWPGVEHVHLIRASELRRVRVSQVPFPRFNLLFRRSDFILHGDSEIYKNRIVRRLKRRAIFPRHIPPELATKSREVIAASTSNSTMHPDDGYTEQLFRHHSLGFSRKLWHFHLSKSLTFRSGSSNLGRRPVYFPTPAVLMEYTREVRESFKIGGRLTVFPRHQMRTLSRREKDGRLLIPQLREKSYVQLSGSIIHFVMSFDLKPLNEKAYLESSNLSLLTPFEWQIEFGPTLALLDIYTQMSVTDVSSLYSFYYLYDQTIKTSDAKVGVFVASSASWYVKNFLSFGIGIDMLMFRSLHIPYYELDNPLQDRLPSEYDTYPLEGVSGFLLDAFVSLRSRLHF